MKELLQLIGRLEGKAKDVQFDIDWMVKKNEQTLVYEHWEIQREIGKKKGLLMAIKIAREEIVHIEQAKQLNDSMDNMLRLIGEMHEIIDNEKQPKSNTPSVEV